MELGVRRCLAATLNLQLLLVLLGCIHSKGSIEPTSSAGSITGVHDVITLGGSRPSRRLRQEVEPSSGAEFEVGGVKYVIAPHGILRSWRDAFYWCKIHDMMLATIPSHAEQQAIFQATRHLYGWFWIGGVYSPGSHSWRWLNGMPIPSRSSQASSLSSYSYWGKGAPYGFKEFHCMAWTHATGAWVNTPCVKANRASGMVCQAMPASADMVPPMPPGRLLVVPGDVDAPGLVCSIASANASYTSASSQCQATGLDLGTVSGAGSNVALRALAPADRRLWLGARRSLLDGAWRWPDGAELDYLNWAQGRPSGEGDCVEMTEKGTWSDVACFAAAYTIPFACCGQHF